MGIASLILSRYLIREVSKTTIAVLAVLIFLIIGQQLVQYLGKVVQGKITPYAIIDAVMLLIPSITAILLPISCLLGVLLGLGRLYIDAEMAVIKACGVTPLQLLKWLMVAMIMPSLVAVLINFYLSPIAVEQQYQLREQERIRLALPNIEAGRFQRIPGQDMVVYVANNEDNIAEQVFLAEKIEGEKPLEFRVAVAERGYYKSKGIAPAIRLENGAFYRGQANQPNWQIGRFDFAEIVIPVEARKKRRKMKHMQTQDLLNDWSNNQYRVELYWRLSLCLAIPILALIALPLCRVSVRQGQFAKILPGILVYLLYMVSLVYGRKAIDEADWIAEFLLVPNLIFFSLGIAIFSYNEMRGVR